MSPDRLRAYIVIMTRDVLPPLGGLFLLVFLPATHQFEYWQLPLIAGLFGVPLVGKDSPPPPKPEMPTLERPGQ